MYWIGAWFRSVFPQWQKFFIRYSFSRNRRQKLNHCVFSCIVYDSLPALNYAWRNLAVWSWRSRQAKFEEQFRYRKRLPKACWIENGNDGNLRIKIRRMRGVWNTLLTELLNKCRWALSWCDITWCRLLIYVVFAQNMRYSYTHLWIFSRKYECRTMVDCSRFINCTKSRVDWRGSSWINVFSTFFHIRVVFLYVENHSSRSSALWNEKIILLL